MTLLLATFAFAHLGQVTTPDIDDELSKRYAAWDRAYLKNDIKALAELLHPAFRVVSLSGKSLSRADYVKQIAKSGRPDTYSTILMKAERKGGYGFAWTREVSQRNGNSQAHEYKDTWLKYRGRWTLLESRTLSEKNLGKGWVQIFDGKSLNGWHISTQTGHGTGGRWVVADGAIVGSQDVPGNGGILITDASYGNVEVELEMRNDFGPDSGLFLRSNEKGQAYQAMIDYHAEGNLMGVYGEGIGGFHYRNFTFGNSPTDITPVANEDLTLPVPPNRWTGFWVHGDWMKLRARIAGNPPSVDTWINGVHFMKFKDTEKRLPDTGGIALQVHGGGDTTKQFVRYRNVRVRLLKP